MKRYSIATPQDLRSLCAKMGWFTEGTNEQYAELFYANEAQRPIEEIVTFIWLCSDTERYSRGDIARVLYDAQLRYAEGAFEAEIAARERGAYEVFSGSYD